MGNKNSAKKKGGSTGRRGGTVNQATAAAPAPSGGKTEEGDVQTGKWGRHKLGLDDFDLLKVLGKGSFGKVMLAKKKDSGKIYAMKTLRKAALIKRNQLEHTATER